jgi:Phosphotransferase enzyme family
MDSHDTVGPVSADQDRWVANLTSMGYREVELIGSGVEGEVYRLGHRKVAKVWYARAGSDLEPMLAFYADVDAANPAIATPLIESVLTVDGLAVTIERELPGTALQDVLDDSAEAIPAWAIDAVTQCLLTLRTIRGTGAMRTLPVVGETRPFRTPGDTFTHALVSLLDRRVKVAGAALGSALPDFPKRYLSLRARLVTLDEVPDTVLHGDLFGANIHVDDDARPVAMLDFGFMTTSGDPRFDAAVTAGVMNMYGPHARRITASLTAELACRLDYDPAVLDLYRSAYAVATSTLFGADLSDGHFRWCISQLSGPAPSQDLR